MNPLWWQRNRLPLAWGLVVALMLLLAVREGLGYWQVLGQWQALAQSTVQLDARPPLGLERLHQTAQARRIQLLDVQPEGQAWQVRGQVADAHDLQAWLQVLDEEGAQPLQWGLERTDQGLRFDARVRP
ncbi:MAG: type II secretion system protein GspM [Paucimonas sp.]|jgi:type II secretion system protein M (XcpZ-type)|uniref:type II secretion system protein GspM n=1 Tax=Pantoea sp. Cy-639 TaxID=2608360 RepID=UPI0014230B22|nr:type II secretion system protein GspM [Pantoea sp. Cy-639]MDR2307270.1 type II secretion system protein GspM [Paucimonas sp.]NIF16240.1 type II secretion system protein GspM [Pantoea sp. Cy-639]